MSGALALASALAVAAHRLRTAAELMSVQFVLDWVFALGAYLFFPTVSALFLPTHLSLSHAIHFARPGSHPLAVVRAKCGAESLGISAR